MPPAVSELIDPRSRPSVVLVVCPVLLGTLEVRGGEGREWKGGREGGEGRGGREGMEGRGREGKGGEGGREGGEERGREGRGRAGRKGEGSGREGKGGEGRGSTLNEVLDCTNIVVHMLVRRYVACRYIHTYVCVLKPCFVKQCY